MSGLGTGGHRLTAASPGWPSELPTSTALLDHLQQKPLSKPVNRVVLTGLPPTRSSEQS